MIWHLCCQVLREPGWHRRRRAAISKLHRKGVFLCRALLRLPPFPLARLELACMDDAPSHFTSSQQHGTPEAPAPGSAPVLGENSSPANHISSTPQGLPLLPQECGRLQCCHLVPQVIFIKWDMEWSISTWAGCSDEGHPLRLMKGLTRKSWKVHSAEYSWK